MIKTACHFLLIGSTILGMKAESRPEQDPKNTSKSSVPLTGAEPQPDNDKPLPPHRRLLAFIGLTARHFDNDKCSIMASSIVYTTLISLVPFLVFYFRDLLVDQFGEVAGNELTTMLSGFISNAGGLGAVGLISFLITSIILINRVWIMINQIYRTPMNRNRLARFARFITILVVGTLLLGAYFSINSVFSRWFLNLVGSTMITQRIYLLVSRFAPWLLTWLLIFMLIIAVPSTRVKVSSALLGSVAGTIAFQLANSIFSKFVIKIVNYSVIYGSLASILIMLIWIYILWIIIFGAVEVAYVHQYHPVIEHKNGLEEPPLRQLANGIDIILHIARHFQEGKGAVQAKALGKELGIPDRQLFMFLEIFERHGFIISVDRTGRNYMPARPLELIKLTEILAVLFGGAADPERAGSQRATAYQQPTAGEQAVKGLFKRGIAQIAGETLGDIAVREKADKTGKG